MTQRAHAIIEAVNKAMNEALNAAAEPLQGRADRWDDGYLNGIKACGAIVQAAMRRALASTPAPTEPAVEAPGAREALEDECHAARSTPRTSPRPVGSRGARSTGRTARAERTD